MSPRLARLWDTFYRYKAAVEDGGVEALLEKDRRKPNLKNRTDLATEEAVIKYAIDQPTHGQARTSNELRKQGVFVFTAQAYSSGADYAARLFFEADGMREDPATGSANSGLAAYLVRHLDHAIDVVVEQGFEMQRPSRLYLKADNRIAVGGRVQGVLEGMLDCSVGDPTRLTRAQAKSIVSTTWITSISAFPMNYEMIVSELQQASAFDLYRL